ncbi:MAG: cation transporter, partial [Gemmatimonadetes bacterium]|nr:cation transporter [Gemmatimonadota bacterium]
MPRIELSEEAQRSAAGRGQGAGASASQYARVSIVLNTLLAVGKLLAGWLGGSFALVADGMNSLSDAGVSVAIWLGLRASRRPADLNHPYGHGKLEQETSRVVFMAVLVTGGGILVSAVQRIGDLHGPPATLVIVVAALAIPIKGWLFVYARREARAHRSDAVRADALNHLADLAATSCVLFGAGVCLATGPEFAWVDDVAAGCVGMLMVVMAGREIHSTSRELLDQMPPVEIMDRVSSIACSVPGVSGVETAVGRKSGSSYYLDL